MTTVQKFPEYDLVSRKCKTILQEKEVRFAGFIDKMGNLIVGGFKEMPQMSRLQDGLSIRMTSPKLTFLF